MTKQTHGTQPALSTRRIPVDVSKLFGVSVTLQPSGATKVGAVKTGTAVGAVKVVK